MVIPFRRDQKYKKKTARKYKNLIVILLNLSVSRLVS